MGEPRLGFSDASDFIDRKDMGRGDTLRYNVMTYVVEEEYDKAIHTLRDFLNGDTDYPNLRDKIERFVEHAIDLVNAIRAKRRFPGVSSLTMAKQQDLKEKIKIHFNELQYSLKKIEKIQIETKLTDIRSTVWVVKATAWAVFSIVAVAFAIEAFKGLFHTTIVVVDDFFINITQWAFGLLGF